jgi:hypothetical protein
MIVVVVVAWLFALPVDVLPLVVVLAVTGLSLILACWMVYRGRRRLATLCFWGVAPLINVLYVFAVLTPEMYLHLFLFVAWLGVGLPVIGGFGAAWAALAAQEKVAPRRSPAAPWFTVIALTLMPLITLITCWPFRLGFLIARPALGRLADQVAAGQAPTFPQWVGPFRIAGARLDSTTGNVGLWIDPNSSGPLGFVRVAPGAPAESRFDLNRGDDMTLELGGGWWYNEED